MTTTNNKVRVIKLSPDSLIRLFKPIDDCAYRVLNPLPGDAHVVALERSTWEGWEEGRFHAIDVYIQSEEFSPVLEGTLIPEYVIKFEAVRSTV